MLVFIYVTEGMYQGLHGINWQDVVEVSDDLDKAIDEINEYGDYESDQLIYSFGLEDEYLEGFDEEDIEEGESGIGDSYCYSDRSWSAWKIRDDVKLSLDELRKAAGNYDGESFVKMYCEEESLV